MNRRIPFAVMALGLAACAPARVPAIEPARTVRVTAKRFEFSPNPIRIARGKRTTLELSSLDVAHGFSVPGLKLRADIAPGQVTKVDVTPTSAGTFPLSCDVFCGDGHDDMSGEVVVSEE